MQSSSYKRLVSVPEKAVESAVIDAANIAVLIPVWQPGRGFTDLLSELLELGFEAIIVVNDGSDSSYDSVFQQVSRSGVHVIYHATNLGKGRALKTGFDYFQRAFPGHIGVVTADADGQHRAMDILRTAAALRHDPSCMVLGSRCFRRAVPVRSRAGNLATKRVFALLTGRTLDDTQSGLRGIPAALLPEILVLKGERYEYEMNVLVHAAASCGVREVPIETVYLDGNRSSHFRPIADSMRIYFVLLRFFASSLLAAGIDFLVFAAFFGMTSNLAGSMIAGRVSCLANFALNRRFVFASNRRVSQALARYSILAAGLAVSAFFSIRLLRTLGMNVLLAKLLAETSLWFASFWMQRVFVFAPERTRRS